ncbi:MAG: FecR family protein [Planctomycetota bacterium]
MNRDRLTSDILRLLDGGMSREEEIQLVSGIRGNAEWEKHFAFLMRIHGNIPSVLPAVLEERRTGAWRRFIRPARIFAAAAMLAVAIGAGWFVWRAARPAGSLPVRPDRAFMLADGAGDVWAEAGTRLLAAGPRALRMENGSALFRIVPGRGRFSVTTPAGTVEVTGTEFAVTLIPGAVRTAVREGHVRLENSAGAVDVRAGGAAAAETPAEGKSLVTPAAIPDHPGLAAEILWRPWVTLTSEERAERLAYLKQVLEGEDYDIRLKARRFVAEIGGEGVPILAGWIQEDSPRLQLEVILVFRQAAPGNPAVRKEIREVVADEARNEATRIQAIITLGEVGIEEDLECLQKFIGDGEGEFELRMQSNRPGSERRLDVAALKAKDRIVSRMTPKPPNPAIPRRRPDLPAFSPVVDKNRPAEVPRVAKQPTPAVVAGTKLPAEADIARRVDDPHFSQQWIITIRGELYVKDGATAEVRKVETQGASFAYGDLRVVVVLPARDEVWLGTDHGLFSLDRKTLSLNEYAIGGSVTNQPVRELRLEADTLVVVFGKDRESAQFDTIRRRWK